MTRAESEMSFWDHLEELRGTLVRSALAVLVLSTVAFCFKSFIFDKIIFLPTRSDFFLYRALGIPLEMKLVNVNVTAQFFVHLKMAFGLGLIASVPYILYEIWKFVAPAFYENEKKACRKAFLGGGVLFYVGIAVGFILIVPLALQFFLNYSVSDLVENTITLNSYISLLSSTVLLFGLVFEFPMLVVLLSALGVIHRDLLKRYRKHAFIGILIVAAIVTPADPLSMIVAAIPLWLLWELSILLCRK